MDESCAGEMRSPAECRNLTTELHNPPTHLAYTGVEVLPLAALGLFLLLIGLVLIANMKARRT